MKAYIQSKKTMILSLSIIAFLFLSAPVPRPFKPFEGLPVQTVPA